MPGLGSAGMAGADMAGAGMGGGGLGMAGVAGAALAAPGMAPHSTAYPQGTMPMGAYGMGADPKTIADCLGVTVGELYELMNPTGGEPREPTKAEMKRQQQLSKKIGNQRLIGCQQQGAMQPAGGQAAQMAQMQQMMAMAQARGGVTAGAMPSANGGGTAMTEAPGQQVVLSDDLAAELKKGKTVVRGIDWVAGSAEVSATARPGFDAAMTTLGQAMKESGQRYRLDLYVDQKYDDAAVGMFAASRIQTIQVALGNAGGDSAEAPAIGKTKRDKNPRLEVVKVK
jgi:hypothetical protein